MPFFTLDNPLLKSTAAVLIAVIILFILFIICMSRRRNRHSRYLNDVDPYLQSKMWIGDGPNPSDQLQGDPRNGDASRRSDRNNRVDNLSALASALRNSGRQGATRAGRGQGTLTAEQCRYLGDVHQAFIRVIQLYLRACVTERTLMAMHSFMGSRSMKAYAFVNDPLFNNIFVNFAEASSVSPVVRVLLTATRLQSQIQAQMSRPKLNLESADLFGVKEEIYYSHGVSYTNIDALSASYRVHNKAASVPVSLSRGTSAAAPFPVATRRSPVFNAPPSLPFVDLGARHMPRDIKNLFLSLKHPHLLPTFDIAFSPDHLNCFVCRPFCAQGSLRDRIYGVADPTLAFASKYPGYSSLVPSLTRAAAQRLSAAMGEGAGARVQPSDVHAASGAEYASEDSDSEEGDELFITATSALRTSPLPLAEVRRLGKQVLLGLVYLDRVGLPMVNLHSGNVILHQNHAYLTDYEGALLNTKPMYFDAQQRLAPHDPVVVAFTALLFEMATGARMSVPKGAVLPDLSLLGEAHSALSDVFKAVYTPRYRSDAVDAGVSGVQLAGAGASGGPLSKETSAVAALSREQYILPPPYMLLDDLLELAFFRDVEVDYRHCVVDADVAAVPSSHEVLDWHMTRYREVTGEDAGAASQTTAEARDVRLVGGRTADNNATIFTTRLANNAATSVDAETVRSRTRALDQRDAAKYTLPPSRMTNALQYTPINPFFHPRARAIGGAVVQGLAASVFCGCAVALLKYYPALYRELAQRRNARKERARAREQAQTKQDITSKRVVPVRVAAAEADGEGAQAEPEGTSPHAGEQKRVRRKKVDKLEAAVAAAYPFRAEHADADVPRRTGPLSSGQAVDVDAGEPVANVHARKKYERLADNVLFGGATAGRQRGAQRADPPRAEVDDFVVDFRGMDEGIEMPVSGDESDDTDEDDSYTIVAAPRAKSHPTAAASPSGDSKASKIDTGAASRGSMWSARSGNLFEDYDDVASPSKENKADEDFFARM